MNCANCGKPLTRDEIGMTKKLVGRGAVDCCCYACLAARFRVTEAWLRKKAEEFREAGCSLFR